MSELDPLIAELQAAVERLRSGALGDEEAARVVEQVAEQAGRLGRELDREARAAAADPPEGQETLL